MRALLCGDSGSCNVGRTFCCGNRAATTGFTPASDCLVTWLFPLAYLARYRSPSSFVPRVVNYLWVRRQSVNYLKMAAGNGVRLKELQPLRCSKKKLENLFENTWFMFETCRMAPMLIIPRLEIWFLYNITSSKMEAWRSSSSPFCCCCCWLHYRRRIADT